MRLSSLFSWRRALLLGASLVTLGVLPGARQPISAQKLTAPKPLELTKLTVKGMRTFKPSDLLNSLAITESHCGSLILIPFCAVSHSPTFYVRSYLDHKELARDVLRARIFYFQRGYRSTTVDTVVTKFPNNTVHVTLIVNEGPPTLVTDVSVTQETPYGKGPVLRKKDLEATMRLEKGAPLNLFDLDSTRATMLTRLQDRGYVDAIVDTVVQLNDAQTEAAVHFTVRPRWEAHVESINVYGLEKIEESTILQSLSFKPGEVYRRSDILNSQRSLYESNLFRRASIGTPENDDSLKNVQLIVQEAPTREVRLAAGFNTVDFVQTEARFTDYNFFGNARRFTTSVTVGNLFASTLNGRGIFYDVGKTVIGGSQAKYFRPTYTASMELRRPWLFSPRNEAAAGAFAHRRSSPGIYVDRGYGTSATFTRTLAPRATTSLNYRFEVTNVDAGDVYFCVNYGVCDDGTLVALRKNQRLSPYALNVSIDRTDDPFSPRQGTRGQFDAEIASRLTASDFRYGRLSGDAAAFLPVGERSVVGFHLRVGYVNAFKSTAAAVGASTATAEGLLHPRKRFYAGGAQSVRGFAEAQLGPRVLTISAAKLQTDSIGCPDIATIANCDPNAVLKDSDFDPRPLGGNILFEGSVEYRFPVITDVTGAVFIDAAYVAQRTNPALPKSQAAATPGFGVRYKSPVGPIRVDIGINPITTQTLPVVTEVTDSTGTRLVTLNIKRTYAPAKSGFKDFLSRLTLHLSIGEAF